MNCENILLNLEESIFENIKLKDLYKIDDFKIIDNCKLILKEEIEETLHQEKNISKLEIFDLLHHYFQFNKESLLKQLNFESNIKFPKIFTIFLICILYNIFVETFILQLQIPFSNGITRAIFNGAFVIIYLIYLIAIKIKINKILKYKKITLKKLFVFEETFIQLKKEFEEEEKEKILETEPSVQLEKEEIDALLSDIFEKPEIEPKLYDRKVSMERRKRRKTR